MNLAKWYHGIDIPTEFGYSAEKFALNVMGVFASMVSTNLNERIDVILTSNPAIQIAAADLQNRKIYFSRSLLSYEKSRRLKPEASVDKVISAMMGITVHEFSHLLYTTHDFEEICKFLEFGKVNRLLAACFNVVEDIYIDHRSYEEFEWSRWMTEIRLNFLFDDEYIKRIISEFDGSATAYLNLLTIAKNWFIDPLDFNETYKSLYNLLISVYNVHDIFERGKIAIELYKRLIEAEDGKSDESQDKDENGEADDKDLENDSEDDGSEDSEDGSEEGDSKNDFDEIEFDNGGEIEIDFNTMEIDFDLDHDTERKAMSVKVEFGDSSLSNNRGDCQIYTVKQEDLKSIFSVPYGRKEDYEVKFDKRYIDLQHLIAARTIVNKPYGLQSNRGNNLRQLHRIATDGKIFSSRVEFPSVGPQEVIILVDCSGSMNVFRDGDTLLVKAFEAALGAAKGLSAGRHNVAVYGHTADSDVLYDESSFSNNCTLIQFKSFDDSTALLEKRIENFISEASMTDNNADGVAIKNVAKHFTTTKNQKHLIVISDGRPAARCYSGDGNEKTKIEVDALRKTGIRIQSISIADSAKKDNDFIYGREFNTCNDDPSIIKTVVSKMFI